MLELINLEKKFIEMSTNCDQYITEYTSNALSSIISTVISKGALYNFRPYEIERNGFKIGKKLNKLPTNIKNTYVYHFDKHDRVLFIDIYGQDNTIINKEFFFYNNNSLERVYFTSARVLRNISILYFEKNKIKKDINWGMYGCSISDYIYDDIILQKIIVRQKEHKDSLFSTFEVIFKYKHGDLESITNVFPNSYSEQRFP
jgi:antitoxin component YwqK of YwqJK toxin-antitoxin module